MSDSDDENDDCDRCPTCGHKRKFNVDLNSMNVSAFYNFLKENIDKNLNWIPVHQFYKSSSGMISVLHHAIHERNINIVRLSIKIAGDYLLEQLDENSRNVLHFAIMSDDEPIIDLIIKELKHRNAFDKCLKQKDILTQVPLHYIFGISNISLHNSLFQLFYNEMSTDDICLLNYYKNSIIFSALQKKSYRLVQLFLTRDDVAKRLLLKFDNFNQSVLHFLSSSSYDNEPKKFIEFVLQRMETLLTPIELQQLFQSKDEHGHTCFYYAYHNKNFVILSALNKSIIRIRQQLDDK